MAPEEGACTQKVVAFVPGSRLTLASRSLPGYTCTPEQAHEDAFGGLTQRNRVLFGPPAHVYVYLSYGIHSLLNFVAEPEGDAAAVLIRALEPTAGIEAMRARRGDRPGRDLCSGPGKLTEALGIGLEQNGADLRADPFRLLPPLPGTELEVLTGPRIGITKAVERPWRFCAADNPHVSRPAIRR